MSVRTVRRVPVAMLLAVALVVAMVGCSDSGGGLGGGGGGDSKKVTIGYIAWDEDIAVTEVWKQLLEAEGYTVETKQLEAAALFSGVANGDLDMFMDAWLPSAHGNYWKKYGEKVEDLGVWYQSGDSGLAVPEYMKDVDSHSDLKKHASEFDGKITGIEPSSASMRILKDEVMPAYGLKGSMKAVPSSTPAMLAALDKAYKAKDPVVVTMWRPHWAFSEYDIKYLKDPKNAWGDPDRIHTIAAPDFVKDNSEVTGWVKNFELTPDQLQGLEKQIQDAGGNNKAPEAVKQWIADNKSLTDKWTSSN